MPICNKIEKQEQSSTVEQGFSRLVEIMVEQDRRVWRSGYIFDARRGSRTVAHTMQDWITNFVTTGNPNGPSSAGIGIYGMNREMGSLLSKGLGDMVKDPAKKERCAFWQKALYIGWDRYLARRRIRWSLCTLSLSRIGFWWRLRKTIDL